MNGKRLTYPLLLLWLLFVATGCGNLYTGEGMEPPVVDPDDPTIPDNPEDPGTFEEVPIMLAFTDPSYTTFGGGNTRGHGPFENDPNDETVGAEVWEKAIFYVYAFRSDDPSINYATQRNEDKETCLIDGSTEEGGVKFNGQYHGRRIRLNRDNASAFMTWIDSKNDVPFYSSLYQTRTFDFFAYYLDDAPVHAMSRDPNGVKIDFSIDGTQDILCTAAQYTKEQQDNISNVANASEKQNIQKYRYSTYTGHRNYLPVFTFPHSLTLLQFKAYGGELAAQNIYFEGIQVRSRYKGQMLAAAKDISKVGVTFDPATTELPLRNKDGSVPTVDLNDPEKDQSVKVEFADDDVTLDADNNITGLNPSKSVYDRKANSLWGSRMMVPPSDSYELTLKMRQEFPDGRPTLRYTTQYTIKAPEGFQPGYRYTIRIAVYGQKQIMVNVIITGWAEGGPPIDIDPDKDFEL